MYKNDYITPDLDFMQATADPAELAKFRLRRGDVLITKDSEEWNDIAVPAFVTQDFDDVVCGYHLSQVRAHADLMDGEYLFRSFRASGVAEQFQVAAKGVTRFGIAAGAIGGVIFPVPPLDEQRAIAAFLDHETARIDALITKKQRLIELLAEKRTTLISHAVTKGLDPAVPMKPSGVSWLPDMPRHWRIRSLKFFSNLKSRSFIDGDWIETPFITYEGIRLIQCGNIGTGVYEEQGFRCISEDTFHELRCTAVLPGDVLICRMRSSPRILAGRACQAPPLGNRMVTAVDNCIVKCADDVDPRLLVYQLSSKAYLEYIEAIARGGTRDRISRRMLGAVRLACPPPKEQRAIADLLDHACAQARALIDCAGSAIDRLHEYRSALISAAVTGKIDVRGEARAQ
ncbi:MAG: hypothetical protein HOP29_19480 [Phycisphaerales bacterium]|nr:hypothetical protein [Phycisphaerales bacterium]